ncbi:MAG: diguanylate cyclase [Planctomycetota bacterium]|nr:diguanylate cyclase [Planctomycetota bacterium]
MKSSTRADTGATSVSPALSLWDALPEPILLADERGGVLFANAAARRWFRCLADPIGLELVAVLRDRSEHAGPLDDLLVRAVSSSGADCRLHLRTDDDGVKPARLRVNLWSDRDGTRFLLAQFNDWSQPAAEAEERARGDRNALLLDLLGATLSDLEYPLGALRWCAALDDESLARLPEELHRPFRAVRKASRHFADLFASLDLRGSAGVARETPRNLLRAAAASELDAVVLLGDLADPVVREQCAALHEHAPELPVFDAVGTPLHALTTSLRETLDRNRQIGAADEVWRRVEEIALRDALTGVLNRRAFDRFATQEFARAKRYDYPLGVALFDLDWFKEVNDTLGHPAGDRLLQVFATYLHSSVRQSDLVARLGGDEFAILMTHTDGAGALTLIQRLRDTAEAHIREVLPPMERMPGVSVGLATLPASGMERFEDLMAAADTALYRAKRDGRGRMHSAA